MGLYFIRYLIKKLIHATITKLSFKKMIAEAGIAYIDTTTLLCHIVCHMAATLLYNKSLVSCRKYIKR